MSSLLVVLIQSGKDIEQNYKYLQMSYTFEL
jgi:hypothetical protein